MGEGLVRSFGDTVARRYLDNFIAFPVFKTGVKPVMTT